MSTSIGIRESWWRIHTPPRWPAVGSLLCVAAVALGCNPDDDPAAPGPGDDPGGTTHVDPSEFDAGEPETGPGQPDTGSGYEAGLPDTGQPDSPASTQHCAGTATPCSALGSTLCETSLGCTLGGDCSGYPGSCYAQYSSYSCNAINGCYWSYSSSTCSGSAHPCSSYYTQSSCYSQHNCSWYDDCTGSAFPCDLLAVAECLSQPGCHLDSE